MDEDRPEKGTMRELWADHVEQYAALGGGHPWPLYLTLSGALGRDIEVLIARGIISRTETGAISTDDEEKIVAVESSPNAVFVLQKRFPGLRILQQAIENVLHSTNPVTWPTGTHAQYCRAFVINLDLNSPLVCEMNNDGLLIPVVALAQKLAQLHAVRPRIDWTLCLTLHGEITWNAAIGHGMQEFLAENCEVEPDFAEGCRALLGEDLYHSAVELRQTDLAALPIAGQQRILMAIVPKKIAQAVHAQGWRVTTVRNIRYGGTRNTAPIVSWILQFSWDTRAATRPAAVYRDALRTVLTAVGQIAENGTIS
jgi:hypothetical protein